MKKPRSQSGAGCLDTVAEYTHTKSFEFNSIPNSHSYNWVDSNQYLLRRLWLSLPHYEDGIFASDAIVQPILGFLL